MEQNTKLDFVKSVIEDVEDDLSNEEIIHLVLDKKVSKKVEKDDSFGQRAADAFASFAGSWAFIIGFSVIICIWIVLNLLLLSGAFDPYPFILLNLVLSCVAAIQAPMIMMSQNRQEDKDRERAENDYKVNLKTEIIIEDLHQKMDLILEKLQKMEEGHSGTENI